MYEAIVFLPLLGAFIAGIFGPIIGARASTFVTSGFMVLVAILSAIAFANVAIYEGPKTITILEWIHSGNFEADWKLRIDTLTAIMLVVVNGVSSLVHIYSIGYMSHDPHQSRFFAYLSLFTFAMLMLVTADNFLQLFFGWEGVGLASYLLIGFWFKKPSANAAAIKAFVVNRVGDFGLILGIGAIFFTVGSIHFDDVFAAAPALAEGNFVFLGQIVPILPTICLLLFMGAMGKSAQFGFHTWLPDAMEGPT
ncbi:MAG TPA: NADH-quinone oxidoreductase subunit L, partial [Rhodobiaceae bacterium]|nr:NADH-quinone oxidoreductase subunit L [Rhodobiaceae bacterium]